MSQKFGNGRWVQEGFLDNRVDGTIVGRIVFAVIGPVDLYLRGNFKVDIVGKSFSFGIPGLRTKISPGRCLVTWKTHRSGK